MKVRSSRRVTGPSLWLDAPGVVADVELDPGEAAPETTWRARLARARVRLGWPDTISVRHFAGGVTLGFAAPVDLLLAATHVNDWALGDGDDAGLEALAARVAAEARTDLRATVAEAERRGLPYLFDDTSMTVGLGQGAFTVALQPVTPTPGAAVVEPGPPLRRVGALAEIPWPEVATVPVVLVTGTNGKTTTTRLLARMASSAGHCVGMTCSDDIWVGSERLAQGDWTGPDGARRVLRDPRVSLAVLETARGGLLRRGLALRQVDVALVTNVTSDHLGPYGIKSLDDMAQVKLTVARAGRHRVLNADDERLGNERADSWFSLRRRVEGAFVEAGCLVCGTLRVPLGSIPITLGGAASYHVANAAAAAAAARALRLPDEAIEHALVSFRPTPEDNPGRANLIHHRGVLLFLDYAHNPDGIAKTMELLRRLPARRRLVSLSLPGDRDEATMTACVAALLTGQPDRILVREPEAHYRRGRGPGEVPALLAEALRGLGFPQAAIGEAANEVDALEQGIAWAAPGDLVAVLPHQEREAVQAWLASREGAR
jgi:cyanophycin synthetase